MSFMTRTICEPVISIVVMGTLFKLRSMWLWAPASVQARKCSKGAGDALDGEVTHDNRKDGPGHERAPVVPRANPDDGPCRERAREELNESESQVEDEAEEDDRGDEAVEVSELRAGRRGEPGVGEGEWYGCDEEQDDFDLAGLRVASVRGSMTAVER